MKGPWILELILGPPLHGTAGEQRQLWSMSQALPVLPGQQQHLSMEKSILGLNIPPAALQLILDLSCCSLLSSPE